MKLFLIFKYNFLFLTFCLFNKIQKVIAAGKNEKLHFYFCFIFKLKSI